MVARISREQKRWRRRGKNLLPVAEVRSDLLVGLARPLPGGEVGILHLRLGQGRGTAGDTGGIQSGQLAQQHAIGPPVEGDVMGEEQQNVILVPQLQQLRPGQLVMAQVEGPPGVDRDPVPGTRLALVGRGLGEVDNRKGNGSMGPHRLHRNSIDGGVVGP